MANKGDVSDNIPYAGALFGKQGNPNIILIEGRRAARLSRRWGCGCVQTPCLRVQDAEFPGQPLRGCCFAVDSSRKNSVRFLCLCERSQATPQADSISVRKRNCSCCGQRMRQSSRTSVIVAKLMRDLYELRLLSARSYVGDGACKDRPTCLTMAVATRNICPGLNRGNRIVENGDGAEL